jgi:formate hydrogenlyase transcriptional activator
MHATNTLRKEDDPSGPADMSLHPCTKQDDLEGPEMVAIPFGNESSRKSLALAFRREFIGKSSALRAVLNQIEIVAPTQASVLILGETGTGKELVARAIHNASQRSNKFLAKVNCAAIPSGLIESEFFGHEKGAFTGAVAQKIGRFESAHKGTLFLDEIGDFPQDLQPKLLRVLQEKEFERVGGRQTLQSDVRLVAATSRNLPQMVADGQFRSDLFYRVNVFPIRIPALRERASDIPLLVWHFVENFARELNKKIEVIPEEVMDALKGYAWPGNIRELQNFIHRAVILSSGKTLNPPLDELESMRPITDAFRTNTPSKTPTLQEREREHISNALACTRWLVGGSKGAAALLGLKRTTLLAKMKRLGISRSPIPCT